MARSAGQAVGDQLREQATATGRSLEAQTATVGEQVQAAIGDMRAGKERVDRQLQELDRLTLEVESIEKARGELADRFNVAS